VRHPSRQLGRTAIELLMERLADRSGPPRHVVFEPELVIRRSSSAQF
jgi:LacI family transcriptional regulator